MTNNTTHTTCLWIFHNFKETVDNLCKKDRGLAWRLIVDYAFEGDLAIGKDLNEANKSVKMAFASIKPLIKLRQKGGSKNGISNNPSGLSKLV